MAASRLNDSQKQELVERYRRGETAQALSQAYGCSPNTVSRVVRAALDPAELEALKKSARGRSQAPEVAESPAPAERPAAVEAAIAMVPPVEAAGGADAQAHGELAIDDADDFADDETDLDAEADLDGESDPELALTAAQTAPAASVSPRPLHSGALPASVYLLVDKTVELDARPLRDFPELGALAEEEQERQGLMLYTNPRQAKRQCGRSQRVIKVPDSGVLERTSRYLLAQGITRLVLEGGSLFALPGS